MPSDTPPAAPHSDESRSWAEIANRFVDHWFGDSQKVCGWRKKRFVFSFAGSATFFLTWAVYIVGSTGIWTVPDWRVAIVWLFVGGGFALTSWFASLIAWKDLSYGPVRLYLAGFSLPYFIWTLIALMYAREFRVFVS